MITMAVCFSLVGLIFGFFLGACVGTELAKRQKEV